MQFSVQRGPCWAANSSSLYDLFAKEGAIEGEVDYDEGKGRGSFVFCDEEVASRLQFRSRELASPNPEEILTVFLWRHLDLLPDEALNTLLLLEAAWLPSGWGSKTNISFVRWRVFFIFLTEETSVEWSSPFHAQKWSRPCLLWRPENLIRLSART